MSKQCNLLLHDGHILICFTVEKKTVLKCVDDIQQQFSQMRKYLSLPKLNEF